MLKNGMRKRCLMGQVDEVFSLFFKSCIHLSFYLISYWNHLFTQNSTYRLYYKNGKMFPNQMKVFIRKPKKLNLKKFAKSLTLNQIESNQYQIQIKSSKTKIRNLLDELFSMKLV